MGIRFGGKISRIPRQAPFLIMIGLATGLATWLAIWLAIWFGDLVWRSGLAIWRIVIN